MLIKKLKQKYKFEDFFLEGVVYEYQYLFRADMYYYTTERFYKDDEEFLASMDCSTDYMKILHTRRVRK